MQNFLMKVITWFEDYGMRRAVEELRKHSAYRSTYTELNKLSDKELDDIGINRSMIHSIALEALLDDRRLAS
jgi:uncharacterized protein YjiS (DUF1127 family)